LALSDEAIFGALPMGRTVTFNTGAAAIMLVAGVLIAGSANAGTITVSLASGPGASNFGAFDNLTPGATSGTSNTYYGPVSISGDGAVVDTTTGSYARPAGDSTNYLYGGASGETVTFLKGPITTFDIYWGSIDALTPNDRYDNLLKLSNGDSITGSQLVADIAGLTGSGDQFASNSNAWIQVTDSSAFSSFTASSPSPAFEFDLASPVPEPSTWALMLLGFASLGFAGHRRRKSRPIGAA
jgi:hypothetical protein